MIIMKKVKLKLSKMPNIYLMTLYMKILDVFLMKLLTLNQMILYIYIYIYIYIINIHTFENKIHNHQVGIFLFTWDFNQQEPDQRGY